MNREILFRGKRKDNGEWVESRSILQFDYGAVYLNYRGSWVEVIPETVGQYTGLTDKNGKKIFEGDIVVEKYTKENFGFVGSIQYNPNKTDFEIHNPKTPDIWINLGCRQDSVSVIGNIHDNADLLEEATQ